jgi:hypothetical protein
MYINVLSFCKVLCAHVTTCTHEASHRERGCACVPLKTLPTGATWHAAHGTTPPATGSNGRASTGAEGEVVELFDHASNGSARLMFDTRPVGHPCRTAYSALNCMIAVAIQEE